MKRALTILPFLLAAPAQAAKVTNLDTVPHIVQYDAAGSVVEKEVNPNATIYFTGTDGLYSLKTAQPVRTSERPIQDDSGLLFDTLSSGRNQGIPAAPNDHLVIWPGSKLVVQKRIKYHGY